MYEPKPIDTSEVTLPSALEELVELLAENAHDHWATQRITDGWTYGSVRSDEPKQHPCLIPYAELPESEKVYDRQNAMETLKAVIMLGFHIAKDEPA